MERRFVPQWAWVPDAAVILFLVICNSWLLFKDRRLESQVQTIQRQHVALEARARDLEKQVARANQPSVAVDSTTLNQQRLHLLLAEEQQPGIERFAPRSITRQPAQPN